MNKRLVSTKNKMPDYTFQDVQAQQGQRVDIISGLALPQWNYVSMALSAGNTTETYTFKNTGASGANVAVVTVVYTDNTRTVLSSVART